MKRTLFEIGGLMATLSIVAYGCSDKFEASTSEPENPVVMTESNLPIVLIETPGHDSIGDNKVVASMKIICNPDGERNHISDRPLEYDGNIEIKLRGTSSKFMEQQKYNVSTIDAKGKEFDTELLGLAAEHDWVLVNTVTDISLVRDALASDLWEKMGHWAPRTRTVEVVLNGKYNGIYLLQEKIKISKNRLNISKLTSSDNTGLEVTGGYILAVDKYTETDNTFESKHRGIPGMGQEKRGRTWRF